jgi:dipeptidyl aminopeptidase/acylaminoacyl peptidase
LNIHRIFAALGAALVLAPWGAASAAPVEAYGRLPNLEEVAISPAGDRLAYVSTQGNQRTVVIQDLTKKTPSVRLQASQTKVRSLDWADDGQLMITLSVTTGLPVDFIGDTRGEYRQTLVYDVARQKATALKPNTDESLSTLFAGPDVRKVDGKTEIFFVAEEFPDHHTGVFSLFAFEPETLRTTRVVQGEEDLTGYLIDAAGQPVAESIHRQDRWFLRVRQGAGWALGPAITFKIDTPSLEGLGATPGAALISVPDSEGGSFHWRELSLKDLTWAPDNPALKDGTELITEPGTGQVIGTIHNGDVQEYNFFDAVMEKHWKAILRAFPGEQVDFVSMTADHSKVVVEAFGGPDGAAYLLVDLATGHATAIGDLYTGVPPEQVATVQSITYPAADGLSVTAYLTLPKGRPAKGLPLIVFPHGGPHSRDSFRFDWWAQAMAAQGYAVLQPQFRGSDGLGGDLLRAGFGQFGRKMQTDLSDGVDYLAKQGTIDPKRACIVGASYGGYAALAGVTVQTGVYRCAVSVAGISDLKRFLFTQRVESGRADSPDVRFWKRFIGVTADSDPVIDAYSPDKLAAKVAVPIMLVHGRDDTRVQFEQSELMAKAMAAAGKPVEFVVLNGEDHFLSRSETRLQMLQAVIGFVEKNNPPDSPAQVAATH